MPKMIINLWSHSRHEDDEAVAVKFYEAQLHGECAEHIANRRLRGSPWRDCADLTYRARLRCLYCFPYTSGYASLLITTDVQNFG